MTSGTRGSRGSHVVSVPFAQRQIGDWLAIAARRHTMHALLELDVTDARRAIREERARSGGPLSFTAFVVACMARAIAEDRIMHAHPKGRGQLALFEDVDVAVVVERSVEGVRIPVPHEIVEGAPAARFAARLKDLVEGASVLRGLAPGLPAASELGDR